MNMLTQFDIFEMIKTGEIDIGDFTEWLGNERMEAYGKGVATGVNNQIAYNELKNSDEFYNEKYRG
jgi:hypothetical protein